MVRTWGALLLLVAGVAVVGCGKQVNVVFVNQTSYTMPLELQPPGEKRDFVGLLEPRSGAVKVKLAAPDDEEAAGPVRWWAGARYKGEFTVTDDTDKQLRIDLLPAGPSQPYAWKGKIKSK